MPGPIQPQADQQQWGAVASPGQQPQQLYPPPPAVPVFQVRATTHTGVLVFWFNRRRTVTGTYDQCAAALRSAQTHNLIVGWWSIFSILLMNWIALANNSSACNKLKHDAQQAQAYAQWWHRDYAPWYQQHYGQG